MAWAWSLADVGLCLQYDSMFTRCVFLRPRIVGRNSVSSYREKRRGRFEVLVVDAKQMFNVSSLAMCVAYLVSAVRDTRYGISSRSQVRIADESHQVRLWHWADSTSPRAPWTGKESSAVGVPDPGVV